MTVTVDRVLALLDATYGAESWHWTAPHVRGAFDIFVGAVLVQHTTWVNAERALERLRAAGALDPARLASLDEAEIVALVRVSGTPTVKARRLRAIARTVVDAGGLDAMLALPAPELRARLLGTHGIGPESADAIALYAAGARVFVIDAYTQRLFRRIGIGPVGDGYDGWQRWSEHALPDADAAAFARHHAHIVLHGKALCRTRPLCGACPLLASCLTGLADRTTTRT